MTPFSPWFTIIINGRSIDRYNSNVWPLRLTIPLPRTLWSNNSITSLIDLNVGHNFKFHYMTSIRNSDSECLLGSLQLFYQCFRSTTLASHCFHFLPCLGHKKQPQLSPVPSTHAMLQYSTTPYPILAPNTTQSTHLKLSWQETWTPDKLFWLSNVY